MAIFESRFNIGHEVSFKSHYESGLEREGKIVGVYFTECKVHYSIEDEVSTLRIDDVPSDLVNPLKQS